MSLSTDIVAPPPEPAGDRTLAEMRLYGGLFVASIVAFCLGRWMGDRAGPTGELLAIAGNATCGWSWLLVRALFQPPARGGFSWPLATVVLMATVGAALQLWGGDGGALPRMAGNIEMLVSSSVLLLALIEPMRGFTSGMPRSERHFRLVFSGVYAVLLSVAVVWINGSPAGSLAAQLATPIKVVCALLALVGMGSATWYRVRHPLPQAAPRKRREPIAGEAELAARVSRLVCEDSLYTIANLKVADLSRCLGEAEYKVTQSITGALGFRNFNHMINHFRIKEAARRLADPGLDHLPVLTIALDCGFGSIGPFNRAFKAEFGTTPTAYRDARRP